MAKVNQILCAGIIVLCFVSAVMCDDETNVEEARTFGHHFLKRISFAIIPAAFVVGVITTLLGALTVVSMKSLGVGVVLLVLTIGQLIARSLPAASPIAYSSPVPIW
ncbi:protein apnoia [Chironomus tepperi]|uniref:protein apnoia n=1 Tax=Chironomus tepperi TaxID=113505 RepID=UPI00391FAA1F